MTDPDAEKEMDSYFIDPEIVYHSKCERPGDWRGGRVTATGYYVYPYCDPRCCRPTGPFADKETALEWSHSQMGRSDE
jgi:hypothetical protein